MRIKVAGQLARPRRLPLSPILARGQRAGGAFAVLEQLPGGTGLAAAADLADQ